MEKHCTYYNSHTFRPKGKTTGKFYSKLHKVSNKILMENFMFDHQSYFFNQILCGAKQQHRKYIDFNAIDSIEILHP